MILNRSFAGPIVNAGFQFVPTGDSTPDAIAGQAITGAALSSVIEFNPVQITGIDTQVMASIANGEMRVSTDGVSYGAYSVVDQPIDNSHFIQVRATSSAVNSTSVDATLTVGGVSATFTVTTIAITAPVVIDYMPAELSTDRQSIVLYRGRGNKFSVTISHEGIPIDLTVFTRFELYGLTVQPIDSDITAAAFDWDSSGEITLDIGSFITFIGTVKTTLIGYSIADPNGVVLWHKDMANSSLTINVINA